MKYMQKYVKPLFLILIVIALTMQFAPKAMAASREEQLEQKIQQIVASIPASMTSDADIALYLHDYIVKNVAYEKVGEHQTAYGALLDGKAVCAGYADAYLRLLTAVGIEARTIVGTAYNADGNPESHAWTMVTIDGKCLFTDVTWDDPFIGDAQDPNYVSHDYFNITMEQMHKDHIPNAQSQKYLPKACNHTGYDFYSIKQGEGTGYGIFNSSTTPEIAAKYFKYMGKIDGKDQFFCEFRFDGDGPQWTTDNWANIAREIGLTGSLSVSYLTGGSVISMTLTGTLSQTVPVTSVSLNQNKLSLKAAGESYQLTATISPANATNKGVTYKSSNPKVATVSDSGIVTAVANGSATITVTTNDGGKTATCTVTVSIPEPPAPPETDQTDSPTEPTKPSQPENTETESTDPTPTTGGADEPTQPTDPAEPSDPTEPTEPSEATEPTDPVEPSEPSDPQATEDGTQGSTETPSVDPTQSTSETQDDEGKKDPLNITTPIIAAGVAALIVIIVVISKRRH